MNRVIKNVVWLPLVLLLASCANNPAITDSGQPTVDATARPGHTASTTTRTNRRHNTSHNGWTEQRIRMILHQFGERDSITIPPWFVTSVERHMKRFSKPGGKSGKWFRRSLKRYDRYYPMVRGIFRQKRLPETLHYMALIESGYNPKAVSSAKAVGLWQFMRGTGKQYGLTVRRGVDQRRDPVRATRAASRYLHDLIMDFGDGHSVLLAMAAYNAGENGIRRRLRKLKKIEDRSFWGLSANGLLPRETKEYIPQIIAAAILGENRARFGLHKGPSSGGGQQIAIAHTTPAPVKRVSQAHKPTKRSAVKRRATPTSTHALKPVARVQRTAYRTTAKRSGHKRTAVKRTTAKRRANTASTQALKPAAKVQRTTHRPAAKRTPSQRKPVKKAAVKRRTAPKPASSLLFTVHSGNSLKSIASAFGTSVKAIKQANKLTRGTIYSGQKLRIPGRGWRKRTITVRGGDTLERLAQRHRVSPRHLQTFNGLRTSRINRGARLVLYRKG